MLSFTVQRFLVKIYKEQKKVNLQKKRMSKICKMHLVLSYIFLLFLYCKCNRSGIKWHVAMPTIYPLLFVSHLSWSLVFASAYGEISNISCASFSTAFIHHELVICLYHWSTLSANIKICFCLFMGRVGICFEHVFLFNLKLFECINIAQKLYRICACLELSAWWRLHKVLSPRRSTPGGGDPKT